MGLGRGGAEALAEDENRLFFPGTNVANTVQKWFKGVHADIGGGFAAHGLSDITLLWMTDQARQAGVSLDLNKAVAATGWPIAPDPNASPGTNTGVTSWLISPGARTIMDRTSVTMLEIEIGVEIGLALSALGDV